LEASQTSEIGKQNLLNYGDIIFLKSYECDLFDHHLQTVLHQVLKLITDKSKEGLTTEQKQSILFEEIQPDSLQQKDKENMIWLAENITATLFNVNDFPYEYLNYEDIREIVIDNNYVIKSF
jgi:hypothetical protein